jgi:hypothetical protein
MMAITGNARPGLHCPIIGQILDHLRNARLIVKLLVERDLIVDPQPYQYSHRHANRQAGDIDQGMPLALPKVADSRFEIVFEHA